MSVWHSPPPDPERARVLEILRAHGSASTSFQVLERGISYWFDGDDAVVGYVAAGRWRVVAGPPVCPPERMTAVVRDFVADGGPVAFFAVDADFVAAVDVPHDTLQIAEQPDWDPAGYHTDSPDRRSLRAQVSRARNKGVEVRRVDADELAHAPGPLRAEIERVLDRWLESRRMSVMRFMVDLEPFTFPEERRYYVAERGADPVGFLAAVPVFARDGWFFEDVIRVPDAPNGTAELMIHTALCDARDRGDTYVTFGMAPLAGVKVGPGRHRWVRAVLHFCYTHLGRLYPFDGVRSFKARFRPDTWSPQYLVACPGPVGIGSFRAVLRAFANGGLLRFGVATAQRFLAKVPPPVWATTLRVLALLLVPWTVLLALADGERWFGDPSIQWAWVTFDVCMVAALVAVSRKVATVTPAARALCTLLCGATLTDVVLSTVQALSLHGSVTGWAALFVVAGVCGPLLATALLGTIALVLPTRTRKR